MLKNRQLKLMSGLKVWCILVFCVCYGIQVCLTNLSECTSGGSGTQMHGTEQKD